jgi:ribosomal protein L7/L12
MNTFVDGLDTKDAYALYLRLYNKFGFPEHGNPTLPRQDAVYDIYMGSIPDKKINAIKILRELSRVYTGDLSLGLKEAKDMIEMSTTGPVLRDVPKRDINMICTLFERTGGNLKVVEKQ